MDHLGIGEWLCEQVALNGFTAKVLEKLPLPPSFYTLGHDGDFEALGQINDGFGDRLQCQ